jgi:hypothetical protein
VLPQDIVVPPTSQRYVLITTVAQDNTLIPTLRIDAKPVKPGANPGQFFFSRKTLPTAVLIAGRKTDILYVEACFEVIDASTKAHRQLCAGFATVSLGRAETGSLSLRPGTFYGRLSRGAEEEEGLVARGGCFCFGSRMPSRVQCEVEHLSTLYSSVSETFPARFICLSRHMDLFTLFRDALCDRVIGPTSKATHALHVIRDNMTAVAVAVLEREKVMDHLGVLWSESKGKISTHIRDDPAAARQQFLQFLMKTKAATDLAADISRWRLILNGVQLLPAEVTKSRVQPIQV